MNELSAPMLDEKGELESLKGASEFFASEFSCTLEIIGEEKVGGAAQAKAKNALPMKPAIFIE